MKHLVYFVIACIISLSTYAQGFEGEVIYQNTYKSKIPSLTDEKFASLMGSTQDYFIKGDKYKSVVNGELLQWQLYVPADNKLYTKMANNEAALWTDAGINADSVISMVLNKDAIDILGYKCDELILNCKSGTQKYYFNKKLSIDPKVFINHHFGNWYYFVSKSNAVPLKTEIDNAQFTMSSTAVKVIPEKLEAVVFQLPEGIKVGPSPY
jgi:hypothetical protein